MPKTIKIRKGLKLNLIGEADKVLSTPEKGSIYAVKPTDFHGITPKLIAKEGDKVKAGGPIFYSRENKDLVFTSPVAGEVKEVVRGDKRKILEIKIQASDNQEMEDYGKHDPSSVSREDLLALLLKSGMFAHVKQRPYDIIANPEDKPKAIFISAFNSAPLSADLDFIMHNNNASDFQAGLDAVTKLTDGKVHLGISADTTEAAFKEAKNVEVTAFDGPHPAGNVGVHIHHVNPVNRGEVVWTISAQGILSIGKLLKTGNVDNSRIIALSGSTVKTPKYFKSTMGACVDSLIKGNLKDEKDVRVVSGSVLSGEAVGKDGFIGFYDNSISVLPEGNDYKFVLTDGWLSPGLSNKKFSLSRTFPSWLFPNKKYDLDTNLNGEERAYVVTGQYEKVVPMDIYPQQLVKSIMVNDVELMENLGIYEVAPEDLALCEFVCTSKIKVQEIVREGLDNMIKEFS